MKNKLIPEEAKRLKIIRKDEKLTQIELGEIIGRTQGAIQKYENGKVFIPTPIFKIIHEKLNYSYEWLINGTGKKKIEKIGRNSFTDLAELNAKYDLLNQRFEDLNKKVIKLYRDVYKEK